MQKTSAVHRLYLVALDISLSFLHFYLGNEWGFMCVYGFMNVTGHMGILMKLASALC